MKIMINHQIKNMNKLFLDFESNSFEYDSNSSLMIKKRGLRGQESIQKFDSLGRVKEEIDSRGFSWRFEDSEALKK